MNPQIIEILFVEHPTDDYARVTWSDGVVRHLTVAQGRALAAEVPPPDTTASWTSGGVEITMNFWKAPNESPDVFAARAAGAVEAMKKAFKPD